MVEAIRALAPDAGWSLIEEDYDNIIWHSTDIAKPSKESVLAKIAELQAEYDAKDYQRKRQLEYPLIGDQLDMLYHDIKNGTLETGNWIQSVESVKEKYPKPE
jgi:hypothetical protein